MDNVYAYVDVPGEGLKKVLVVSDLSDISDIGSLEDVYVTTTEGKRALAVINLAGGGGVIPNPSRLNTYLPKASPYTTPALSAGVPTKLLVPTTQKTVNEFTLDLTEERYFFDATGRSNIEFDVAFSTSMSSSASNHIVTLEMYKNGVLEEGVGLDRFISGGADVGAVAFNGTVVLSDTDYIEVYITAGGGGTVTLSRTTISINEKLGAV